MARKENSNAYRALEHFADVAPVKSLNITPWWNIEGKGLHYSLESFNLGTFAHLCVITMKGRLGLWTAASVVCVPYAKDLPMLYINYEKHCLTETINVDLFDTLLGECDLSSLEAVKQRFAALPPYPEQPHWFDFKRLSPSDAKMGKRCTQQFTEYADEVVKAYAALMPQHHLDECDEQQKMARVDEFIGDLVAKGSPTLDHVRRIVGDKDIKDLLTKAVFGRPIAK